jgi:hypothetical protein
MKKWLIGLIVGIIFAALIISGVVIYLSKSKTEWKTYESKEWGFRVKHPADWKVVEDWDITFYPPPWKGKVYFRIAVPTSPKEWTPVSFNETFSSLDAESQKIYPLTGGEVINKSELRETKLLNKRVTTEEIEIDNKSGHRVTEIFEYLYLDNKEKGAAKLVSNLVWVGKELYVIQFSTSLEEFPRWEKIFESMFSSFQFLEER